MCEGCSVKQAGCGTADEGKKRRCGPCGKLHGAISLLPKAKAKAKAQAKAIKGFVKAMRDEDVPTLAKLQELCREVEKEAQAVEARVVALGLATAGTTLPPNNAHNRASLLAFYTKFYRIAGIDSSSSSTSSMGHLLGKGSLVGTIGAACMTPTIRHHTGTEVHTAESLRVSQSQTSMNTCTLGSHYRACNADNYSHLTYEHVRNNGDVVDNITIVQMHHGEFPIPTLPPSPSPSPSTLYACVVPGNGTEECLPVGHGFPSGMKLADCQAVCK